MSEDISNIRDVWLPQGICRDEPLETFFSSQALRGSKKREKEAAAKRICVRCPVIDPCLDRALRIPFIQDYGILGGTTREERQELRLQQTAQLPAEEQSA